MKEVIINGEDEREKEGMILLDFVSKLTESELVSLKDAELFKISKMITSTFNNKTLDDIFDNYTILKEHIQQSLIKLDKDFQKNRLCKYQKTCAQFHSDII